MSCDVNIPIGVGEHRPPTGNLVLVWASPVAIPQEVALIVVLQDKDRVVVRRYAVVPAGTGQNRIPIRIHCDRIR